MQVQSLGWEEPLEEGMAAHSGSETWFPVLPLSGMSFIHTFPQTLCSVCSLCFLLVSMLTLAAVAP